MKSTLSLVVLFLLLGAAPATAAEEVSMTLEECLARALDSSWRIREGSFAPPIAETRVTEAESAFDPLFTFRASGGQRQEPATSFFSGAKEVNEQTFDASVDLSERTRLGTIWSLGFQTNDLQTNSQYFNYRPQWSDTFTFSVTQPLLRGGWRAVNEAQTKLARADLRAANADFRAVLQDTLASAERAYWRLVFLRGDLALKRRSLETAKELLRVAQKRLDAGAGTRIEVVQAEAGVAEREKDVIAAESALSDGEDLLRSFVFPFPDTEGEEIRIVPADDVASMGGAGASVDTSDRIRTAFASRPDVQAFTERLEAAGIRVVQAENDLLPRLDVFGQIGFLGIDDGFFQALQPLPTGDYPAWQVGITLEIPLGNRGARARHRRAVLEQSRALAGFESLKNQVVLEVRTAARAIETANRQIDATRKATAAAEAQFEAEQDRVAAQKATNYELLQVEDDLSRARTQELLALVGLRAAVVELERSTGTYLSWRGLEVPETPTGSDAGASE